MASFFNINGTTQTSFKIGKGGPTISAKDANTLTLPTNIVTTKVLLTSDGTSYINKDNYTGKAATAGSLSQTFGVTGTSGATVSTTTASNGTGNIVISLSNIDATKLVNNIAWARVSSLGGTGASNFALGNHNHSGTYIEYGKKIKSASGSKVTITDYTTVSTSDITLSLALADGAVSTAAKLADNVITTAKILDNNITVAKIASGDYSSKITNVASSNNVSDTIGGLSLSNIFEYSGTNISSKVKTSTKADSATSATNDSKSQAITGYIRSVTGNNATVTVKTGDSSVAATTFTINNVARATSAGSADTATKVGNLLTINYYDDTNSVNTSKSFNGSSSLTIDMAAENIIGLEDFLKNNKTLNYKGTIVFSSDTLVKYTPSGVVGDLWKVVIPSTVTSDCKVNNTTIVNNDAFILCIMNAEACTSSTSADINPKWAYFNNITEANYVHTSGNESISGTKTVTGKIVGTNSAYSIEPTQIIINSINALNISKEINATGSLAKTSDIAIGTACLFKTSNLMSNTVWTSIFKYKANSADTALSWELPLTKSGTIALTSDIIDSYNKTESDERYVDLTSAQTISGAKTFSSTIVAGAKDATGTNYNTINGHLIVEPSYTNTSSYNEGLRINKGSNGWSVVALGGSIGSQTGQSGVWLIGKRGNVGSVSGSTGDLIIEYGGSTGNGLTLFANGNTPRFKNNEIVLTNDSRLSAAYTKTESDGKYVDLTSIQTISGAKTFTEVVDYQKGFNITGGYYNGNPERNARMEIGKTDDGSATTPCIDFHTDGKSSTDYNVRLLASGTILKLSGTFAPGVTNAYSLGTSDLLFRNLYLSGDLSDGTNSVSISNILKADSISAWAKATTKPSYNFSEIGSRPTTLSGYGITDVYNKTEVNDLISSVYRVKGSVDTFDLLPTSNRKSGDVYNVVAAFEITETTTENNSVSVGKYHAGTNFVWNGTNWDSLGGSIDLSGYYDKTGVDNNFLKKTGGTVSGTLILSRTTDLSGTANNKPALIVGGTDTSTHLEIDCNEIQAKATGTTTADLHLNHDGGKVYANSKLIILEDDSRLTDSRNAKDVYAWAKASVKPSYTFDELSSHPTTLSGYGITDNVLYTTGGLINKNGSVYTKLEDLSVVGNNSTSIYWGFSVKNTFNSNTSGYGSGIVLRNGSTTESTKWGGIAAVAEFAYSNETSIAIYASQAERLRVTKNNVYPTCTMDLGSSTKLWKDLYLSGNLTDGTNSISIASIMPKTGNRSLSLGGSTNSSISYADKDLNPNITFTNLDASQCAALIFNDTDSYGSPASITLVGNQGGEYFISPNMKTGTLEVTTINGPVATSSAKGLMSETDKSKLDNIASGANKYVLPAATTTTLGGIKVCKINSAAVTEQALTTTSGRYYKAELDSTNNLIVNVPWTDTHYTTKLFTSTSNTGDSNLVATNPYINIIEKDSSSATKATNSHQLIGSTGISVKSDTSGNVTWAHTNSITAGSAGDTGATRTLGWSGSFVVPKITYDAQGHISGVSNLTITIPGTPTDTKNTAGSTNSASKLFFVGATSQAANQQTYSNTDVSMTAGIVTAKAYTSGKCTMQYNSDDDCMEFIFA